MPAPRLDLPSRFRPGLIDVYTGRDHGLLPPLVPMQIAVPLCLYPSQLLSLHVKYEDLFCPGQFPSVAKNRWVRHKVANQFSLWWGVSGETEIALPM